MRGWPSTPSTRSRATRCRRCSTPTATRCAPVPSSPTAATGPMTRPPGDYGEEAHWQRFVDAYIERIKARPDCGLLTDPNGPCAPEIAHLMGVAAHGMGDEVWDWLFEPYGPDLGETYVPPDLAAFIGTGGLEFQMDVMAIVDHGRPTDPTPAEPSIDDLLGRVHGVRQVADHRGEAGGGQAGAPDRTSGGGDLGGDLPRRHQGAHAVDLGDLHGCAGRRVVRRPGDRRLLLPPLAPAARQAGHHEGGGHLSGQPDRRRAVDRVGPVVPGGLATPPAGAPAPASRRC